MGTTVSAATSPMQIAPGEELVAPGCEGLLGVFGLEENLTT